MKWRDMSPRPEIDDVLVLKTESGVHDGEHVVLFTWTDGTPFIGCRHTGISVAESWSCPPWALHDTDDVLEHRRAR